MALLLGFDIGTTSTIGIVVDSGDRVLATASRPTELKTPRAGWAEQAPLQWWQNVCALVPECLQRAGVDGSDIGAIGVSGMVPALVILDCNGQPVRPSIQQADARSAREVELIRNHVDEASFLRRTANGINQQLLAPKLRWLRTHEPNVLKAAHKIMGSYDYIGYKLTGQYAVEKNWALESGFLDLSSEQLAPDLIELAGIEPQLVPNVFAGHDIVGEVTSTAAAQSGLVVGTPVVAGGADHVASAFVAGVSEPGDLLIKFGGAADMLLATSVPKPDARLFLDYHTVPGLFLPNGCMATSGSMLNWFVRTIGADEAKHAPSLGLDPHAYLDALAAQTPPGGDGLVMLPYFLGEKTPIHDPHARGTIIGLSLHHDTAHLWRAALESVCYGFKHHLDVVHEIGYPVERILASDGGTRSQFWMQIAASVLGKPIQLLKGHPGACLGAAYLAGVGLGAFKDWRQMPRFVATGSLVEPDDSQVPQYEDGYSNYRELYERLKPLYPRLG